MDRTHKETADSDVSATAELGLWVIGGVAVVVLPIVVMLDISCGVWVVASLVELASVGDIGLCEAVSNVVVSFDR